MEAVKGGIKHPRHAKIGTNISTIKFFNEKINKVLERNEAALS